MSVSRYMTYDHAGIGLAPYGLYWQQTWKLKWLNEIVKKEQESHGDKEADFMEVMLSTLSSKVAEWIYSRNHHQGKQLCAPMGNGDDVFLGDAPIIVLREYVSQDPAEKMMNSIHHRSISTWAPQDQSGYYHSRVAQQQHPQYAYTSTPSQPTLGQGLLGPAPAQYRPQATTLPSVFSTMTLHDPTWHMDTGASSHLNFYTSNLGTIFDKFLYPSVYVGNGNSIPVTNTGHNIIPFLHRPLHLNNILVTPNILKNLISVRRFTRDNNCTIEFDVFGFFVKDFLTRHILLRCDGSGDLYPVIKPSTSPTAFLSTSASTWHQRLGHLGDQVLRSLVSRHFISYNKEKSSQICHACQLDKHVKLSFHSSDSIVEILFILIYGHPPLGSGCYLLIYVDDIILTASSLVLLQQIVDSLHKEFDMTDLGALNYFLGISDVRHPTGLFCLKRRGGYSVSYLYSPDFILCCSQQLYVFATTSLVGYTDADWAGCPSTRSLYVQQTRFTPTHQTYEIDIHCVRDMVKAGHVWVLHVPSRFQYVDIFTKGLPSALFEDFRSSLSVWPPSAPTAGAY
ncbi:ribonuclease H-like domain-containing protein [Tanacetum coccineum]